MHADGISYDNEIIEPKQFHLPQSDISYYINDLAYHGTLTNYETDENVQLNINIGYIIQSDDNYYFMGNGNCIIYHYALVDIQPDTELSRYYGLQYWQFHEFQKQTHLDCDLPSERVIIDEIQYDNITES